MNPEPLPAADDRRGFLPFRLRWLAVGLAALAAAAFWFGRDGGGPWVGGRGFRHWFPLRGIEWSDWEQTRLPGLLAADASVLPVLVAALNDTDTPEQQRLDGMLKRIPGSLAGWVPRLWPASQRREAALVALNQWIARSTPERIREVKQVLPQLPEEAQSDVCRELAFREPDARQIEEFLAGVMADRLNPRTTASAALGLLQRSDGSDASLGPVLAVIRELPPNLWSPRAWPGRGTLVHQLAPHTEALGRLGAEAWLAPWLSTGAPPVRTAAALLLPFIAPERHPVRATLERALPTMGPQGMHDLVALTWFRKPGQSRVRREFVDRLAPVLLGDEAADWWDRWSRSPDPAVRAQTAAKPRDPERWALHWLGDLGADAAAAAPYVPPYLDQERASDRLRMARCLARIGPVAPETIPELLPHLDHEVTGAPLVLLLAAYGPAARAAVPVLRKLAANEIRLRGRPDLDGLGAAQATEFGFPRPAEVRALRRDGPFSPALLRFGPALAKSMGLTRVWPEPAAAPLAGAGEEAPGSDAGSLSLAELAAEALRRIGGDAPVPGDRAGLSGGRAGAGP